MGNSQGSNPKVAQFALATFATGPPGPWANALQLSHL